MSGRLFSTEEPAAQPSRPTSRFMPLAARMRPLTAEELVGQERLLAEGSPLRVAIESGRPFSMLLHGPPGSGKTTTARIVAQASGAVFEELSAVQAGKAEVTAVLARARDRLNVELDPKPTVLFLDEIHRFNKAQQDALLPAVEDGTITLIGATTESPAFTVNSALLSRMRLVELEPLSADDLLELMRRAIDGGECGELPVSDDALEFIARKAAGDARMALGALELACSTAANDGAADVDLAAAEAALQSTAIRYDRDGDQHYDTISAWIKATRGSDPDASLYYLAVMLEGGEDPRFIARRMVILASEDVGNAAPQALGVATATAQAVELVGMPEAAHALAQCAVYLALSPKSNASYEALGRAREYVREHGPAAPPSYLRSATRKESGYEYPHDRPGHIGTQELLPESVVGQRFYVPDEGEQRFAERAAELRRLRGRE